jgi:hypothetical protein
MMAIPATQQRMSNMGKSLMNCTENTEKASLMNAYVQTSMIIPESIALISEGANAWASGNHV